MSKTAYLRFGLWKEARGYSVWSIGLSGSRQECYGHFTNKATAMRVLRTLRRQALNA